jgi:hypothetical protein
MFFHNVWDDRAVSDGHSNQWPYANMVNRYQLQSGADRWGGGVDRGGDFAWDWDRANLLDHLPLHKLAWHAGLGVV